MSLGEDLSLDLLDEGSGTELFEDIVLKPESTVQPEKKEPENKQPGEDLKSPESVAGEEGKTKAPEKNANSSVSSPSDEQLSQIYSSLATHLHQTGVLSSLNSEKPIKSFNDLQAAIKNEITNGVDELTRSYQEAMENGVPQSEFVKYERAMEQLNGITPEVLQDENNSELRFKILAQDFLNRDFSREDAERYAKRSLDLGEDVADAQKALENIKNHTKSQFEQRQAEIKKEEEKVSSDIKQFIDKTSEFIEGIKLDENQKDKLFKQITTPIARDKDGTVLSKYGKALRDDPVKMKVVTEYLFMITNGFSDFSKLNSTIETAKTKELDTILKNNMSSFTQEGVVNFDNKDPQSSFLSGDFKLDI